MNVNTVGLIGLGRWGKKILTTLTDNYPNLNIVCSGTQSAETRHWLATNYPAVAFVSDPLELISNPEISHIYIATPIDTHYHYVSRALEAHHHVFVEKPATKSQIQSNELLNTAIKNGRYLFIDHIFSAHPCFRELLHVVNQKKISQIFFNWNKYGSFKEDIFWNLLYHDLYLLQELVPGPYTVDSVTGVCGFFSNNDVTTIQLKSISTRVTIHINRLHTANSKSILVTTNDEIFSWSDNKLSQLSTEAQNETTLLHFDSVNLLKNQVQAFFDLSDNPPKHFEKHHEYSLIATALIETIQKILLKK